MYAVDPAAVAAFWTVLARALRAAGVADVPAALTWPDHLPAHWRDPNLLLSQTCGYPFATLLRDQVRYLATPRFTTPGCDGACYASAVVVRAGEPATALADLRGSRVAFNSRDSHSGFNALRALIAPLATDGRFFGAAIETGSHAGSLAALSGHQADVAAIDAVTLALVSRTRPDAVEDLRVLAFTEPAPGLPFITSRFTPQREVATLRRVLGDVCGADEPVARALLLDGVAVLPHDSYEVIRAAEADAVARGYPDLC